MVNIDVWLEYLSSPDGINKIILGILAVISINAIFIISSVS